MMGFPSMAGHGGVSAGYPTPGGAPSGAPGGPPGARGGPAGGSNPNYFTDKKKGEVNELKNVRLGVNMAVDMEDMEQALTLVVAV